MDMKARADEAAEYLLTLAASPDGARRTDIIRGRSSIKRPVTMSVLARMVAEGILHTRMAGRETRYFCSASAALAWIDTRPKREHGRPTLYDPEHVRLEGTTSEKLRPTMVTPIVLPGTRPRRNLSLPRDAPVVGPMPTPTVLPSAQVYARHQVPPGVAVIGCGFAALGPGRYLPEPAGLYVLAITLETKK